MKRTALLSVAVAAASAAVGVASAGAVNGTAYGTNYRVDGTSSAAVNIQVQGGYGCFGSPGGGFEVIVYNTGTGRADVNNGRCTSGNG